MSFDFLHSEIGSAKDNLKSSVHNWYKFAAGFSYKFVEEIIRLEKLDIQNDAVIFDPFAGCGTTLVCSQKSGIKAIGNEAQAFMYEIIKAKLNWAISEKLFIYYKGHINNLVKEGIFHDELSNSIHPLLAGLYDKETLKTLYLIRQSLQAIKSDKYRLFFKLALSQTLHKVSIHPIASPYICRKRILYNRRPAFEVFLNICEEMYQDTLKLSDKLSTSKIYKHDSRKLNKYIKDNQCSICITSPPYLNNLDYGEVSKVHTHFFDVTRTWNDITKSVRKKLVTSATTQYAESDFNLDLFLRTDFALQNRNIIDELVYKSELIKKNAQARAGNKSFDILLLFYFRDMYLVLKEIKRVLKNNSKSYIILGDSAPYGVFISTTELLGKVALNIGFSDYNVYKIRTRGTKWKSLKYRHKVDLSENLLVLN